MLRESLSKFAAKYRSQINADPEFRRYFTVACQAAGVDPLASNKATLGKLLGMGDFYFALGVQVVDVAMAARSTQGVLLPMELCLKRLAALRGAHASAVSVHDVRAALKALEPLGRGVASATVNGREYIVTLAQELSSDTTAALEAAAKRLTQTAHTTGSPAYALSASAHLSPVQLAQQLGWSLPRATDALHSLLRDGVAWLDAPPNTQQEHHVFFFPGLAASPDAAAGAGGTPPDQGTAAPAPPQAAERQPPPVPALPPSPKADSDEGRATSPAAAPAAQLTPPCTPSHTAAAAGANAHTPQASHAGEGGISAEVPSEHAACPEGGGAAAPSTGAAGGAPRPGVGGLARLMALSGSSDIATLKLGARGRRR